MNRSSRTFTALVTPLAAALATLFAAGAQAQAAETPSRAESSAQQSGAQENEATALSTINVTAKGYAADDSETPIATTVLTREALAHKQAQNVGEALRGEPGLSVMLDGAQGQNPIIRGLGKDSIVLLVDGMRLNSAQPVGAIASFMSMGLAEQVEVVKGPASVLYGTGALGGAINVRLPQARFEPGVHFDTRLGYDTASKGLRGAGVLNAASDDHALMLGVARSQQQDYRTPDGRANRTGYDSGAFIGQYRFRIDSAQQLRLSFQQQRDEDVWYPGATRPHRLPVISSVTTHSPRQTRRLYEAGYSSKGAGEQPLNVDVRVYRQEMQRTIYAHANRLGRDIILNSVKFATNGVDARADWLAHPQHLLSFGVNLWRMNAEPDSRTAQPPQFRNFVTTLPFTNGKMHAAGLYLQDDMRFGKLNVLAGLRHDRVRGSAGSMNSGRITSGLAREDSATSASLGVIYEAAPLLRPYANLSRAFRAADLRERYQSGLRNNGYYYAGSPQIKPETATQFEIGLKGASERLNYQISAYRTRIDDYITGMRLSGRAAIAACGAANAGACMQTVNLGHATLTGLEAALHWQFAAGHWLHAAYSRLRGKNGDFDEPLFQMPADELTLGWEGRIAPAWTADAGVRLVRRQTRVATRFARGTEDATPGFGVVDIGATWRFAPRQSLRAAIKNLGDKRYHEHLAEGLPGMEVQAPGRSLHLTWEGRF